MNDILISVDLHTISGDELLAAIDVLHEVANDDRHLTTVERVQLQLERRLDWDSGLARSVAAWLVKGIPILRNVRDYRPADMARGSLWERLEVVDDEA